MDVVTIGEALASFAPRDVGRLESTHEFTRSFGGSEANTAIGLARLGHSVRWISVVGDDPLGRDIVRALRGEGVDVTGVRVDRRHPTAVMIKELRAPHDARVHYYRHDSAATTLGPDDLPATILDDARWVHLTGITLALGPGPRAAVHTLLERCAERDIPVSFDPNLRRKQQPVEQTLRNWEPVFPHVHDLLLSEVDARLYLPDTSPDRALRRLHDRGFRSVVITCGDRGAIGIHDGQVHEVPAMSTADVVDTVGGGDAFNAGFLHERLRDAEFARCLGTGAWVASHVVGQHGDWEGLPTEAEYDQWTKTEETIRR